MGKLKGFLEYKRELPEDYNLLERVKNWNEFHANLSEEKLTQQGARCMDCGTPFCHTGMILNGMASGCPINNLIPEWNDLIYNGHWREALDRLHKTNNFPEFTGRVCPAPCEGSCVLGLIDSPVTIKNNECAIIDKGFKQDWIVPCPPKVRTGKKVAVIGSGPAGLSCAAQLNKVGHRVTVYERDNRIGGLLMYGIPNMKLEKKIIQRRVDLLAAEGIKFITNTEVGKDLAVTQLLENFDATVLCCGSTKPRDLNIEGRQLKGIHFAMEFLKLNTKAILEQKNPEPLEISAENKDVVIIGGGDTGTDCVATALRHGCKSVTQLEIMPHPPLERTPDNPWPEWPKVYKLDYGQEEAKAKYGKDPRKYLTSTSKFIPDNKGNVKALHIHKIKWIQKQGRYTPEIVPGTEQVIPAQLVFLAMGFLGPEQRILKELNIKTDARSNVKAEYGKFETNIKGIFAAGDMRRGQSLVVWAINEGRAAARQCDKYLMGSSTLP
jgi:glutamate synthase (NADPH) small chain